METVKGSILHRKCQQQIKDATKARDYWRTLYEDAKYRICSATEARDYWRTLFCPHIAGNLANRWECAAFGSYIIEIRAAGLVPAENWETPCLKDEAQKCPLFEQRQKGGFPKINWPPQPTIPGHILAGPPMGPDTTSEMSLAMKKWREEVRH